MNDELSGLSQYWIKRDVPIPVHPNERLLFLTDEHWIKYVFPSIVYAIITVAGIALLSSFFATSAESGISMVTFPAGLILLTSVHHWFFWFLMAESNVDIIVTDKRVVYIHAGLLFAEDTIEISFEKLKAMQVHKTTILQSILNYGTLDFEGKAQIAHVPHPGTIARKIQQAMGMI